MPRKRYIARRLHQVGGGAAGAPFDPNELLEALGDTTMINLLESRGCVHAVVARRGRMRRVEVGPVDAALKEAEFARFLLRRIAVNPSRAGRALNSVDSLQSTLLGDAAQYCDGPVVIVAPARLQTAPWSLLPCLAALPMSVSPSARLWLRATQADLRDGPAEPARVALVVGPDLMAGAAEIAALQALHPAAAILGAAAGAPDATTSAVLRALEGTTLAHLAAHGHFRADSPMFSSLLLDEGPLYVHDLDTLVQAPRRIVLSACDSGVSASVGADELLDLVSALLRLGSVGVLASAVTVRDEAAVGYMGHVHSALASGGSLPEAALAGRQAASDPLGVATAASFTVWGR